MVTIKRWPGILWAGLLSVLSLIQSSVHRRRISVLRLKWNWSFGVGGLLPRISHGVAFTDKSTAKAVIT